MSSFSKIVKVYVSESDDTVVCMCVIDSMSWYQAGIGSNTYLYLYLKYSKARICVCYLIITKVKYLYCVFDRYI